MKQLFEASLTWITINHHWVSVVYTMVEITDMIGCCKLHELDKNYQFFPNESGFEIMLNCSQIFFLRASPSLWDSLCILNILFFDDKFSNDKCSVCC
jgi:hypothetical protein